MIAVVAVFGYVNIKAAAMKAAEDKAQEVAKLAATRRFEDMTQGSTQLTDADEIAKAISEKS